MSGDLPIYPESPQSMLRTGLQFADLERLKGDTSQAWDAADRFIAEIEGASNVSTARASLVEASKEAFLGIHFLLFAERTGAGQLRTSEIPPLYRGQDCAPPQFIERSLDNLMSWLAADSFKQIHPIEKCALTIARIIDVWPFEFGNLTTALVFANSSLKDAELAPFYVMPEHRAEFEKVIAQAMTIDMQPLINAIFRTVKKDMEALAKR